MKSILILVTISIFFIQPVFAQEEHTIDKQLDECMENSKYITSKMVECCEEAQLQWEQRMDKYYKLLMNALDERAKKALRNSQAAWVEFKNLEFKFIPQYFQDTGSYTGPVSAGNRVTIIRDRALQLKSYYQTVIDGGNESEDHPN